MDQISRGPRAAGNLRIRQVYAYNFAHEIACLNRCLRLHNILSVDTEFPGFIKQTPRGSVDVELYADIRYNINRTKVIQIGLTALDESGNIGGSWEFNFSDFDVKVDTHNPSSISFLIEHGLNLEKIKREGIPMRIFAQSFLRIVRKNGVCRWITFHGLYDIGYLIKAMGIAEKLPESIGEFARIIANEVGIVRDLKHMSKLCRGLQGGELGLEKLSQLLGQKRYGSQHNAGSDSLLTALLHLKMFQRFDLHPEICDGFMYGFSHKLGFVDIKPRFIYQIPIYYGLCY